MRLRLFPSLSSRADEGLSLAMEILFLLLGVMGGRRGHNHPPKKGGAPLFIVLATSNGAPFGECQSDHSDFSGRRPAVVSEIHRGFLATWGGNSSETYLQLPPGQAKSAGMK